MKTEEKNTWLVAYLPIYEYAVGSDNFSLKHRCTVPSFLPSPQQRQYEPVLIALAEEKAGATFHVIRGNASSRWSWAAQAEKGFGKPEKARVNSVVSESVSVGRSRRPRGEAKQDSSPG